MSFKGSAQANSKAMNLNINLYDSFRDLTLATSFVNISFTTFNIYKLNSSKDPDQITSGLFFATGALQTAFGIGLLSEKSSESLQLAFPNIIVGTATSVTSLVRAFKKNPKEKILSIKPIYLPKADYGIGCRIIYRLNNQKIN